MKKTAAEGLKKLIQIRTSRRESPVQLRVLYSVTRENGCDIYQILAMDDCD